MCEWRADRGKPAVPDFRWITGQRITVFPPRNTGRFQAGNVKTCPERHHVHYPPVYYDAQQNYNRGFWTIPGCRTGGAMQDYTSWTDSGRHPVYLPVYLDSQQHQDQREYRPPDGRSRDLLAPQQAASLREDWQRRWESSGSAHCAREASKRSNSSYRELEAWAARYSHSLPRRRRIEAELRGATQSPGDDFRALRPVRSFSGAWDRAGRQTTPSHILAPAAYSSLNRTEEPGIQSQPPGYIAPPAYDGPHKRSPANQNNGSQSLKSLRQQCVSQLESKKEDSQGLKDVVQETLPNVQYQCLRIPAAVNIRSNKTPDKVIEGRKFSFNKKMGGMTIFCLVSRTAATTGPPNAYESNTEPPAASCDLTETQKMADEVDCQVPTLTETPSLSIGEEEQSSKIEAGPFMSEAPPTSGAKYPLWKEPSLSLESQSHQSAAGSSSAVSKTGSHLVIDTTCVLVKMEVIPSPEKSLIHYVGPDHFEENLDKSEWIPETLVSERESLEERAERILGIPLHDSVGEEEQKAGAPGGNEKEAGDQGGGSVREDIEPVASEEDGGGENLISCEMRADSNDDSDKRLGGSNSSAPASSPASPLRDTNQADAEFSLTDTSTPPDTQSSSAPAEPSASQGEDDARAHTSDLHDQASLSKAIDAPEQPFEDDFNEVTPSDKQEAVEVTATNTREEQEPNSPHDDCECGGEEKVEELQDEENSNEFSDTTAQPTSTNIHKEMEVDSNQDILLEAEGEGHPSDNDSADGSSGEHSVPRSKEAEVASEAQCFLPLLAEEKTPGFLPTSDENRQEASSPDVNSQTHSSEPLTSSSSPQVEMDPRITDEPEYPKSLWDAVNRIRRHTAPDSENEEEEPWDPEFGGQQSRSDETFHQQTVFGEPTLRPASAAGVDEEGSTTLMDLDHELKTLTAEDDTLSCSSHDSGDTVIDAEEDEESDTTPGADVEILALCEERCCSGEVDIITDGGGRMSDGDENKADGEESKTQEGNSENKDGTPTDEGGPDAQSEERLPVVAMATSQENKVITETISGLDNL
ncbi:uncharacterized protein si:ch211-159e12.5 [Synchiropus splendidus]|uniref:uncharacterized protein si:ch211-159e12.5 n=1 Tax=Synchiropus splendidus TaxID=270530 RepID=UPI00237D6C19|nr:uncharacterized protein si:ch211-159e12.5 [Synchiropus splendidus]